MAKTTSNVSAPPVADKSPAANPKTATAPKPEPKKEKAPIKAEDRDLTSKARRFLVALAEKPMTSKELQAVTRMGSSDISSYIGSVSPIKPGKYPSKYDGAPTFTYWDAVARRGDTGWRHLSLIGRGLVAFKKNEAGKVEFSVTKAGAAEARRIVEAEKAEKKTK